MAGFVPLTGLMAKKVARPFTVTNIYDIYDMFDIRDMFDKKIWSHIFFQSISKIKAQKLTVET